MKRGETEHDTTVIGLLVESRYRRQLQPGGLVAALADRGVEVIEVTSAATLDRCDLVVARGRSRALLSLLEEAERCGLRTVNRAAAVRAVVHKAGMQARLEAAGVPTPATWHGPFEELCVMLRHHRSPLVIKPVEGDNCRDVAVVADGRALAAHRWTEPTAIVQQYVANDGHDLKLYGVGDSVWAVRKQSPLLGAGRVSRVVPRNAWTQLAHRCRDTFGLDVYGVDCIPTADGLVVIEVNDFPNFTGIDEASGAIADHCLLVGRPALAVER